ncbi:PTS sugar transporter subunit IIB [uncultured Thermanaerothrix sp.]|uniref:PTS sugar transporter subunit IIB n=1 Tax=uncultured Thermanaerothrix sp. TaxID=1195149 RepID=UPI0026389C7A|nr:PTS sugar transporter subunit IIB [uncultured Thermanaerothrix sp.]
MPVKRIIVACGSGVATSNVAAEKLRNLLREQGYHNVEVRAVDIKSLEAEAKVADLLVSITPYAIRDKELPIPSINGIPLLTGVGTSDVIKQVKDILKL